MFLLISEIFKTPIRLMQAAAGILVRRKLLMLSLVPVAIGAAVFLVCVSLAFGFRGKAAGLVIESSKGWLQGVLVWGLLAVNVLVSALVAVLAMSVLGSLFIENFIVEAFRLRGIEPPSAQSLGALVRSTLRSLKDDLRRLGYIALCGVLVLLAGLVPVFFFVAPLMGAFLAGFNAIDLPLALMEVRFRERWRLALAHWQEVLALGAGFLILLLIPLGGVLFLPVVYYLAVEKLAAWGVGSKAAG